MKHILLIFLISLSFLGNSKTIPNSVLVEMNKLGFSDEGYIYLMNPEECASCGYAEIDALKTFAATTKQKVYLLFNSSLDQERTSIIFQRLNFVLTNVVYLNNAKIYSFYSAHNFFHYTSNKYKSVDLMKGVTQNTEYNLVADSSYSLPIRNQSFYHHLFFKNDKLYTFNRELGEVKYLNDRLRTDSISLYTRIDKNIFFNLLHLTATDSAHTKQAIFEGEMTGNRFVDVLNFCPSNDSLFYFTVSINYNHEYSVEEVEALIAQKNSFSKDIQKTQGKIISTRNQLFLVQFDAQLNFKHAISVVSPTIEYHNDFYSPFYIDQKNSIGNLKYYPSNADNFKLNNYAFGRFQIKQDSLVFLATSKEKKPSWFYQNKVYNNYSTIYFQTHGNRATNYVLTSFPSVFDIDKKIKFEIPYEELKKLAKQEKNELFKKDATAFITLGAVYDTQARKIILIRSIKTKTIYALTFNAEGTFQSYSTLIKGGLYTGYFCVLNNLITRIEGNVAETYRIE